MLYTFFKFIQKCCVLCDFGKVEAVFKLMLQQLNDKCLKLLIVIFLVKITMFVVLLCWYIELWWGHMIGSSLLYLYWFLLLYYFLWLAILHFFLNAFFLLAILRFLYLLQRSLFYLWIFLLSFFFNCKLALANLYRSFDEVWFCLLLILIFAQFFEVNAMCLWLKRFILHGVDNIALLLFHSF